MLAGCAVPAFAFQPLVTDDTGTQGSGGNQLELSVNEDRAGTAASTERLRAWPLVYTRGLTESLDVFAGLRYARIRSETAVGDASGSGNPSFGAKWRFYENEENTLGLAVKSEVLLPVSTGRERAGLGNGRASGALTLILTQKVRFGAIHANVGYGRDGYRDALNHPDTTKTRASIAPVWNLTDRWKLAVDLGAESSHAGGVRILSDFVELGAIYSPSKDLDLALGLLRWSGNDNPRTTKHSAAAGITWRFQ